MKLMESLLLLENDEMIESLKEVLEKHCYKYVKKHAFDNSLLIRGMKVQESDSIATAGDIKIYKKNTYTERKPRDSHAVVQKLWDEYFNDRFGVKYRSQNVAFCFTSTDRKAAPSSYGDGSFIIIPCGDDYSMCYANRIIDFFTWFDPRRVHYTDLSNLWFGHDSENLEKCVKALDLPELTSTNDEYDNGRLMAALYLSYVAYLADKDTDNFDLVFNQISFTNFEDTREERDRIIEKILKRQDKFFKTLMDCAGYQAGDFKLEEIKRSEVMLHCKEYLAIPVSYKREVLDAISLINN
jgi:hypothetical protein